MDDIDGLAFSSRDSGQGLKGIQRIRRRVMSQPDEVVAAFRRRVKNQLGVSSDVQHWSYSEYAKLHARTFGRLRGLWRCYHILSEVLDMWDLQQKPAPAKALICQAMKCLHQVALDKGDWQIGGLLLLQPDPLALAEFGGEEREMEDVYRYRRSLRELKSRHQSVQRDDGGEADAEGGNLDDEGPKGQGKDKKKKKPKAKADAPGNT